jgi:hypothetical protein
MTTIKGRAVSGKVHTRLAEDEHGFDGVVADERWALYEVHTDDGTVIPVMLPVSGGVPLGSTVTVQLASIVSGEDGE